MLKLAVLISGRGSTLANLIQEKEKGKLDVEFTKVISSSHTAPGISIAKDANIPCVCYEKVSLGHDIFNARIHDELDNARPDLIVLAGFIHRLEPRGRLIMNVHPSLIPSFCGKGYYGNKIHREVLESGVKITGATVHFCDDEYDTGPIILQKAVSVTDRDTVDTLKEKVQAAERDIYPEAIRMYDLGRLKIEGRRVLIV